MKHVVILIYAAAVVIGTGSCALLGYFAARSRRRDLGLCFTFFLAYTLDIFSSITLQYIAVNVPSFALAAGSPVRLLPMLIHFFLMFSILMFLVSYVRPSLSRVPAVAAATLSLACWMYDARYPRNYAGREIAGIPVVDLVFFSVIALSLCVGYAAFRSGRLSHPWISPHFFAILAVFFPFIVNDDLRWFETELRFSPIMYSLLSILLIRYLFAHYLREYYLSRGDILALGNDASPSVGFFDRFGVTGREREVALLVLRGYGNGKIAEELCVSVATVKSHVYSLFKKTGVSSRFELMHLAKNHTEV